MRPQSLKLKASLIFPNASKFELKTSLLLCSSSTRPSTPPARGIHPNPQTLLQLLKQRPTQSQLKQIHAQVLIQALHGDSSITYSLIRSYLTAKNLNCARILFYRYPSPSPPTLLWNLMIRAYSKIPNSQESISLFSQMLALGRPVQVFPDKYTFTFLITSCSHRSSVIHGEIFHGLVMRNGFEYDLHVSNSLINLYCVFLKLENAHKLFDQMPERDVFTWTSLLCGYAKNGELGRACGIFDRMPEHNDVSWAVMISGFVGAGKYVEALQYFHDMLCDDKVKANEAVLVCALSACAHLGALDQGNWIHVYIDKSRISKTTNISTALTDMYAKCGRIDCAKRVFNRIYKQDVLTFTSMISGLAIHGLGKEALLVFSQMLAEDVKPNDITVLGVLKGCSHSGLVEEGSSIFYNMESLWGIVPKIEHYGCYIDLLARAGYFEGALRVVKSMPMEPDIVIWRALLSSCRVHHNADLGRQIIQHLWQLDSHSHSGGEVLLSNLYAALGQWQRVDEVRKLMGEKTNESSPGCSWIEISGVVHEFRVADCLHPQIEEIRNNLTEFLKTASLGGYIANTMPVSFELSQEEKEQAVSWHSEKLAIAFALMSTQPGSLIRVVKNLRTCEDCHSALKAISQVYNREIVVRDCSRFHTFKEGNCSCNDYW
ncbi:pentatricopeptide repeat-containing protein At5g66520-like [Malania oleifera]|uniref:pentatricopeptide repeat-containing protein At5g66520-like n=1 Tax=Malania oleifera TaxID=397392 RepID=UPI0025AE2EAE|nr:pentatricopeptide repeat-containing protein At5g66520-like [Malania oleifera]XP_057950725.1 pentatricopeptide repeat-containing protein At5g66520-like [Malania oleifera]XP_057950726.1 pentatricopeptide repeat-containing protein At5g66520-like [Malania oleifera]XP_057950727.1 pentatricopeptide repeat-containing protein At5g66520-like [Malania oleifera]XP_057950728.1 pentatricopeptide repeat-containing protein At5g66520-like [Malania oleifera]XP_057950729.1 pentatricopeptide repeat-containing